MPPETHTAHPHVGTAPMSAREPMQQIWPDEPVDPPPKTSSGWVVAIVVLMLVGTIATVLAVVILWLM
jgi:hypothetical protein